MDRGERQKDTTDSYRENWERIFGNKELDHLKDKITIDKESAENSKKQGYLRFLRELDSKQ